MTEDADEAAAGDEPDSEATAVGDEPGRHDEEGSERSGDDREEGGEPAAGIDEDLIERVEAAEPETLAQEVAGLRERAAEAEDGLVARQERIEELETRVEDLESKLKRERADFQNYKKRMDERREAERRRATEDLVERLLDVRDNLARALDQDEDVDVRDGIESTLRQFDRVLGDEDVERIEPEPGAEVDPRRHEVLTTVESDQPGGTVADRYRPGYEMGEKVLRPAQVTVSEADAAADGDGATADSGDTDAAHTEGRDDAE